MAVFEVKDKALVDLISVTAGSHPTCSLVKTFQISI